MSRRCSFKTDGTRCSRNGSGDPPYCRAHALQVIAQNTGNESLLDFFPPEVLESADRFISQNGSEIVRGLRNRVGAVLADLARSTRPQTTYPPPQGWDHPPRPRAAAPPPPPPPPPPPQKSPEQQARDALGFAPDYPLTRELVKERRKALGAIYHPDKQGGSVEAMQRVNAAADTLLRMLS